LPAYSIVPISEKYISGYRHALDVVAREKKYISFYEAPALEELTKYVREGIEKGHPHFVALEGEKVAGWCDIKPNLTRPVYTHCGIVGIGLLPEYRTRGLGRKLLEHALEAAFAFGLLRIELTVVAANEGAVKLYKSLGFEIEGLHRKAALHHDYYDLYSMALLRF
jgi:ribosomal protein S18 acetylase RimI-like enzyme